MTSIRLHCRHCGNRTPHEKVFTHSSIKAYDYIGDDPILDPYDVFVVCCGTCEGVSLVGGFRLLGSDAAPEPQEYPILYPVGPDIKPPSHTVTGTVPPIPAKLLEVYTTAWPLRYTAPAAFANQIRRALEFLCQDKAAVGKSLFHQLQDLARRQILPSELADIAMLIRDVGNRASHAAGQDISMWDAELLDELFKLVIRYVYIGPAQAARMRERLGPTD